MRDQVIRFCRDESGSATVEYCLVASGVFALTFPIAKGLGGRQLRSMRSENRKLKKLLAELMLDVHALKEARGKI